MVRSNYSRRQFLFGGAAALRAAHGGELILLEDPRFERGCVVLRPEAGKKVRAGTLVPELEFGL